MKFSYDICKKRSKKSAEIDHCAIARETLAGLLIRFANLRCTLLQCQKPYEIAIEFYYDFLRLFQFSIFTSLLSNSRNICFSL